MNIPFSPPDISELEINEVIDALKSGCITTGPRTKLFENIIAQFCGTPKAVAVNSCTAALELVLRYYGVGPGDEVIVPAYTYTANLARKGTMIPLTTCLHGSSMESLIRYMKDSITIIPVNRKLKVGDIVLYKRADGKYVVHRLYRIIEDEKLVQTWGDNCDKPDPLMPISSILGIVLYLQKNGKQQLLDTDEHRKRGINWINSKYRRRGWMMYKKIRRKIGNVLRKMT